MIPESRTTYDDDLFPGRGQGQNSPPIPSLQIFRGTVGWADDSEHADIGTADNDSRSYVKVTLFHGKHITGGDSVAGQANGFQVLTQTMGPFYWVPPKGTTVIVAFPDGHMEAPGAGVIIGSLSTSPLQQFGKNSGKIDLGPDQNFTIKARRITLMDYKNNFISVGIDTNIVLQTANGSGGFISDNNGVSFYVAGPDGAAASLFTMDSGKVRLVQKDSGYVALENGNGTLFANKIGWVNAAVVYLGSKASPSNGAVYTATSVSTSVFISI